MAKNIDNDLHLTGLWDWFYENRPSTMNFRLLYIVFYKSHLRNTNKIIVILAIAIFLKMII